MIDCRVMSNAKLDDYIAQAKSLSKEHKVPVLELLEGWETNDAVENTDGLVEYYKNQQNGTPLPVPSATPAPVAKTSGNLSSFATEMLAQLATSYDKTMVEIEEQFWKNYEAVKSATELTGKNLEEESIMWVQAELHAQQQSIQEASYTFIPFEIGEPYEGTDTVEEPDPNMPGQIKKVPVKVTRAMFYGIFTKHNNDGTSLRALGKVACLNEEMAHLIQSWKPFHEYSGTLEGRPRKGYFNLRLQKDPELQGEPKELKERAVWDMAIELAKESGNMVTPETIEVKEKKMRKAGTVVFIEARISHVYNQVSDKDSSKKTPKMILTEATFFTGEPNKVYLVWWDESKLYTYQKKSHIIVVAFAKHNSEFGWNYTGNFMLPVTGIPGTPPTEAAVATGRG